ncbi:aldo/keto reductase [Stackebrandtia soli]|uniref:aldo/keto reductase n=1 Tax=Stackebrandtia soli TaxID=1892856 RepID=UPI0039E8A4E3
MVRLNDGHEMPTVGLGTYPMGDVEASHAVLTALQNGYRLIDTATRYGNETGVGQAIRESGVPREEIFLTTKLPGADQGYESTVESFEAARQRLDVEYVDLYLIHWPLPRVDHYVESFEAMLRLQEDGLIRSVGVSNFAAEHLRRVIDGTGVVPVVNQIELHPAFNQAMMREVNADLGIVTQAWSPLGRGTDLLDHPTVTAIADAHGVTAAQVILRWEVQLGAVPIPKSGDADRQAANLDIFGFSLTDEEMTAVMAMESGRIGGDPDSHEEF